MIASTPIVHRVGGVADLGARRTRLGPHRLEHLRRDDHRHLERPRPPRHFLLNSRHPLERQLESEVAARHHDGVAFAEDLLETRDRLRALELGHERNVRRRPLRTSSRACRSTAAVCTKLKAMKSTPARDAEAKVFDVLRGQTRRSAARRPAR